MHKGGGPHVVNPLFNDTLWLALGTGRGPGNPAHATR